jgi:hypothetical protein
VTHGHPKRVYPAVPGAQIDPAYQGCIYHLKQRVDGFVSADAGTSRGELITKPLSCTGAHLWVNVNTSSLGRLLVEVQDESGQVVPGFEGEACESIMGNLPRVEVSWPNRNLSSLEGQRLRLRFLMSRAKLYSFWFGQEG